MDKTSVLIFVESRYKVSRKRIKETVLNTINKNGMGGPFEVSVAIVGDRKMRELSKKYKGEDKTRNKKTRSVLITPTGLPKTQAGSPEFTSDI